MLRVVLLIATIASATALQADGRYSWGAESSRYAHEPQTAAKVAAVDAQERPKVYLYTREDCLPCVVMKHQLGLWQDCPVDLVEVEKLPSTPDITNYEPDAVPTVRWFSKGSWWAYQGWHGKAHLLQALQSTGVRIPKSASAAAVPPPPKLLPTPMTRYPTSSEFNWTGPDGVHPLRSKQEALDHLLLDPNHGPRFIREFLSHLSLSELRAIHSDDHDRRVQWAYLKPTQESKQ